ncbi:hypothetical protein F8O01_13190 [Pseudoclavibacter chungangensis]|uniref:Uncharacterized protein n=1 Tax=Pseudoclavibacter chungangensis TaxID=587635 RepID=A0A7J5BQ99_9MICO|nr:hypothetical protein [Pseudoclavibacter chungangensis]KAB1654845.1 hypothetical protein F8O01_13190 [Pseudoclavibacter chungangensis]NYJ68032.1 hypothetical protein [Pseudoclavibacter chungangensis]
MHFEYDPSIDDDIPWSDKVIAHCFWTRSREPVIEIAASVRTVLDMVQLGLQTSAWRAVLDDRWHDVPRDLEPLIEKKVVEDDNGEKDPELGYSGSFIAKADGIKVTVRYSAGSIAADQRVPTHKCNIILQTIGAGIRRLVSHDGDVLVEACVKGWNPDMAFLTSPGLTRTTSRRNWQVPDGYRLWLRNDVARIRDVPSGLSASPLGDGTLVRVPDSYEPDRVVAVMAKLRELNDLDTIPH